MTIDSVLLVRPPAFGKIETPVGLLFVSTALKQAGIKVDIADLYDRPELEDDLPALLSERPDTVLGVSALVPSFDWVRRFVAKVRQASPSTRIVTGGHIAVLSDQLLHQVGVDAVCLGEGEMVMPELISRWRDGLSLEGICGVAWTENGETIRAQRCPLLREFPMPDYSLLDMERYVVHPAQDIFFASSDRYRERAKPEDRLGAIMFSRGCVGACGFCYRHLKGFRQADIPWCMEHISTLYHKYNVRYLRIDDELLTNSVEWLRRLHDALKASDMDILFRVTGMRVDQCTPEVMDILRDMGCIAVNFGLESGSQEMLDNMNKGTTVEQGLDAIRLARSYDMDVMGYIIIGYAGETVQTLRETARYLMETGLSPERAAIYYAMPFPGTKLFAQCKKLGIIPDTYRYLVDLAPYFEERLQSHEYYFVNVCGLPLDCLRKWEEGFRFLMVLSQLTGPESLVARLGLGLVGILPNKGFSISLLNLGRRVLAKLVQLKKQRGRA